VSNIIYYSKKQENIFAKNKNKWDILIVKYYTIIYAHEVLKGKLTKAWGLGGLVRAHSKEW